MLLALIILPLAAGLAAWFIRSHRLRRSLLVAAALGHAGLTGLAFFRPPAPALEGWLALDAAGLLFLAITSGLFLAVASTPWATWQGGLGPAPGLRGGCFFSNAREAVFTACLLAFLAMMTLVCLSQHFGLLWVAVEATTLASAPSSTSIAPPLPGGHRKYLMICSVGIALALLGNFFLAVAATLDERQAVPLVFGELMGRAGSLHAPWLKAAFIFLLVGYGTKQGLAPLHTWLPDAHSESPSLVSALLSGALLNCAFLAILRALGVCAAAGLGDFARELLVGFGLLSMLVAAGFILAQADYKRLLAYSSVEHMGILALAAGLGATGGSPPSITRSTTRSPRPCSFWCRQPFWRPTAASPRPRCGGAARSAVRRGAVAGGLPGHRRLAALRVFFSEFWVLKAAWTRAGGGGGGHLALVSAASWAGRGDAAHGPGRAAGRPGRPPAGRRGAPFGGAAPGLVLAALGMGLWLTAWLREVLERPSAFWGGLGRRSGRDDDGACLHPGHGQAVEVARVPRLAVADFRTALLAAVAEGRRIACLCGVPARTAGPGCGRY